MVARAGPPGRPPVLPGQALPALPPCHHVRGIPADHQGASSTGKEGKEYGGGMGGGEEEERQDGQASIP